MVEYRQGDQTELEVVEVDTPVEETATGIAGMNTTPQTAISVQPTAAASAQPAATRNASSTQPATSQQAASTQPIVTKSAVLAQPASLDVNLSSAQVQGNLPAAREEIKDEQQQQQPEVIKINGKEYTMDVERLNLNDLSESGVTGGEVWPILSNSSMKSLTSLELSRQPDQWQHSDGEFPQQLRTFLGRQTQLVVFLFQENNLTTLQTTQLLQCIAQSNKQLKEFWVNGSCNFDSDESVQALAQCIDKCRAMTFISISDQVGGRKVKLVYIAGESISVVTQGSTTDVLHSLPTTRTSDIYLWQNE